jgi:hypothetical protein
VDLSSEIRTLAACACHSRGRRTDSSICIAFADVEGAGDQAVEGYDMRLFCPILLVSRVVIFNWMGGLRNRGGKIELCGV